MKILFVSQYFYPENFRINDLAVKLTERGHEVEVLTGLPNYPAGEYYEGYSFRRGPFEESWNGIKIHRVPMRARHKGSKNLCLNYLSFVIAGCLQAATMDVSEFDVVYAFGTSPITQAIPALLAGKRAGAGVIINVQDLWPDNVIAITGLESKLAIKAIDILVDFIYNSADVVLGTSRSFVKAIRSRKGLKEKRKVGFWPQYSVVKKSEEKRLDVIKGEGRHVVFAGNVGHGQGLDMVIHAAKVLKAAGQDIIFDIVGDGRAREELEAEVVKCALEDRIVFHGSFPESEIPSILAAADAALLILNRDPIFEKTIPAKLQTYLACGMPVLACVEGEARSIIEKNNIGIVANGMSGAALAVAASHLFENGDEELARMGENALALSMKEFDSDVLIDRLVGYMELLKRREN